MTAHGAIPGDPHHSTTATTDLPDSAAVIEWARRRGYRVQVIDEHPRLFTVASSAGDDWAPPRRCTTPDEVVALVFYLVGETR